MTGQMSFASLAFAAKKKRIERTMDLPQPAFGLAPRPESAGWGAMCICSSSARKAAERPIDASIQSAPSVPESRISP